MADNFQSALATVMQVEGGFSDIAADPGGATNHGVTQSVWQSWVGHPVTVADIQALTVAEVAPLYQRNYWNADQCQSLPSGLDLCVFDSAVNNGDGRAARLLQSLVGVTADGAIGPATLAAVLSYVAAHGVAGVIDAYMDARLAFYRGLVGWAVFGNGWGNRVTTIRAAAHTLC